MNFGACLAVFLAAGGASAQERDVTIGLPEAIDNLDPFRSARNDVGRVIKQNVVETLTQIDPANGSVVPRLATSWETIGEKGWRFRLREGVSFHDGAAFDASAVAKAIERTLNPGMDCTVRQKFFGGITVKTEIVDPLTIDITTEPRQPILPTILSALALSGPSTPVDQPTTDPVGTGPSIGRASCRERVCQYVSISVVAV